MIHPPWVLNITPAAPAINRTQVAQTIPSQIDAIREEEEKRSSEPVNNQITVEIADQNGNIVSMRTGKKINKEEIND